MLLLLLATSAFLQLTEGVDITQEWTKYYSATGAEVLLRSMVPYDHDESYFVCGYGAGSFVDNSTQVGMIDAILAKLDASGNLLWSHQFGTTDDDYAESVAVRHNRIYVVGNTRGVMPGQENAGWADGFIKAFDISGNEAWTIQFGSNQDDYPRVVKTSHVGHVVVAGYTYGGLYSRVTAGAGDMFVVMYASNGNRIWRAQRGSSGNEFAWAMDLDTSQDVYIAGDTTGNLDGQTLVGSEDMFLMKFRGNDGTWLWTITKGGTASDRGRALWVSSQIFLLVDTKSTLYGSEVSNSTWDVALIKYDLDGNEISGAQVGSASEIYGYDLKPGFAGGWFAAARLNPTSESVPTHFAVLKFDESLAHEYTFSAGCTDGTSLGWVVEPHWNYPLMAAGYTNCALAPGSDGPTDGNYDMFLTKFVPGSPTTSTTTAAGDSSTSTGDGTTVSSDNTDGSQAPGNATSTLPDGISTDSSISAFAGGVVLFLLASQV
ncbi:unnamed protein product [Symbiodinium sp. CCMP2456]|nr:unnamed protein product [Symbiodinium sp. CCMP2456]